jgi:hypothetical protein
VYGGHIRCNEQHAFAAVSTNGIANRSAPEQPPLDPLENTIGTTRKWRDVRLESAIRQITDIGVPRRRQAPAVREYAAEPVSVDDLFEVVTDVSRAWLTSLRAASPKSGRKEDTSG